MLSLKQLAEQQYAAYVQYMNPSWQIPDFHYQMMNALMDDEGCLISLPPDHAKSTLSTILFSTWCIGRKPDDKILIAVGSPKLKSAFAILIRRVMESQKYKAIFSVKIRKDSDGKLMFHTEQGGQFLIVSRGEGISGIRANVIVFDDLVGGAKESRSPAIRKQTWDYLTMDLLNREDKAMRVKVVGVGTRWHKEDVLCKLDDHPDFQNLIKIKFKAISDDGKALWPERYSVEDLQKKKKLMGSANFSALYQQDPQDESGGVFKREWFKNYYKAKPDRFDRVVISVDAAFSKSEDTDYVVFTCWGRLQQSYYLLDSVRERMNFPETKKALKAFAAKWPKAFKKIIEKKANGAALIDDLKDDISGMVAYTPTESKESRASAVSPLFEAGNIYLPDPSIAPWIGDYVNELTGFPNSGHDDWVDSTSQALIELRDGGDWITGMTKR